MKEDLSAGETSTVAGLCDRVLFGLFASMLCVSPFLYHKYMDASVAFRRPKETAFQLLCILIVGTWLIKYLERGRFSALERLGSARGWLDLLKRSPIAAPVLMLVVACLVSLINVASQFYYWDTAIGVFGAVFIIFILYDLLKDNYKRLLALLGLIAIASSFMGAYCMLQYYNLDPLFVPRKAEYAGRTVSSGFIDNPNTVSGYLVAALPLLLSIFFFAKRREVKVYGLAGAIALFGGLLSACTRGALLAGVFSVAVFLLLVFFRGRFSRGERRTIAIAGIVVMGFIVSYVAINPFIYDRIANTKSVLSLRTNTRYIEWASGKRMIADHFLIGLGLGNFKYYYLDYRGDAARETGFIGRWEKANQAHNEYVQAATELGFVGLFAVFWLIGSFSWFVIREGMKSKRLMLELDEHQARLEQRRVNLLNGLLGSFLGLAGHCASMFPLHIVPSAVIGVFVIAMALAASQMPRRLFDLGEPSRKGALFGEADYAPFMTGVFLLGGFLTIPILWAQPERINMTYGQALPWAIGACLVVLAAFRRNGTISWLRAAPAAAAMIVAEAFLTKTDSTPALVAFAVFAVFVIMICGYIGIGVGRLVRRGLEG
ncbi:MAG: O-antigen ligase family protein [Candidatus Coatesbacteria bacterium]|nr:O-antigen ligase family protein [Candidatus Coatesbacteria bacterium]